MKALRVTMICLALIILLSMGNLAISYEWIQLPNLNYKRWGGSATLMQDGRVLIVGGQTQGYKWDDRYTVAEAEIFDPATKSFTPTGTLNQKRRGHGAVLLNDGKVLIAGGSGGSIFPEYKSVEIYDPSKGDFNLVGDMSDNRIYYPTCTLLPDGRVLIAGGAYEGWYADTKTAVDIYDPLTETLQLNVGDLLIGRTYGCAILLSDDNILFIGGYSRWDTPSSPAAELYDYTINTSNLPGIQPQSGEGYDYSAVSLSNGKVLVKKFEVAYPEYYDPITTTFEPIGCYEVARGSALLLKDEKVLFTTDPIKVFNPTTEQIEQSIDWPAGPGGFQEDVVVLNDGSVLFWNPGTAEAYLLVDSPEPDIKANGQDGPVFVSPAQSVNIGVLLHPGDMAGETCHWWIGGFAPFGNYWVNPSLRWVPSSSPISVGQYPLFNLSETTLLDTRLPVGIYIFFFVLDDTPDGAFGVTWYDYVNVICQPEAAQMEALPDFEVLFQEKIEELMRE